MAFELLNIKDYVQQEKEKLKILSKVEKRRKEHTRLWRRGIYIKLGIIDATNVQDSANQIYIRNKVKDFSEMEWNCDVYKILDTTDLREVISQAAEHGCTSIIVQLPVREGIKFQTSWIPPHLDCDGLNPMSKCNPATPTGIINYLKACEFSFAGKTAVILGRSDIVGKPMARMLLEQDMTVSICHSKTPSEVKQALLKDADLVVSAVGKIGILTRADCPNAIVIDVGINQNENGKLCGDFIEDPNVENMSTPVPGGVGLLTRLALLQNCFDLAGG